nr:tripartite motif-containing protein 2-like [Crassostrea gigas]
MNTAQDVVRCSQCTEAVTHHCKICQKNLCLQCKDEHIDKSKSTPHEIIPFTSKHHEWQKCVDHPTELKTFYCQDCKVPICQLCPTRNHKRHGIEVLKDICETSRMTITGDLKELKIFKVEYSKVIKGLEEKATIYTEHTNHENSSLMKLGEELHKIVDREIERIQKQLANMVKEDLQILQDNKDEMQGSYKRVKYCIERNNRLLEEDNPIEMLEYKSSADELRLVPSMKDVSPPKLIMPNIKEEKIIEQVVSLKPSVHSILPGFTISKAGDISMVSTRVLMTEPTLIKAIFTYSKKLKGICCESDEKVWIYGDDEEIKQLDKSGSILNVFNAVSKGIQKDIAINKDGHIAFAHEEDECINLVNKKGIEKFVDMAGWIPYGLCFNSEGDLMVCMRTNNQEESKVGVFANGSLKQEIQFDNTGKPLFLPGRNNMYICENGNGDICVSDWNARAVIVMKKSGEFRFRYTGSNSPIIKNFYPHGIATDSCCRILVADRDNNCVRVIDRNGTFLRYIKCGLKDPYALSLDSEENLWVGECDTNCIRIIKYLE